MPTDHAMELATSGAPKVNMMSKRHKHILHPVAAGLVALVFWAPAVTLAELYKYKNEDGVTVLDSHVPARYVKDGYMILSLDGRVLEVVPRALTDEEIRTRDRELAEQERIERARREKEIADQYLMRLYGTPADVIRARDTKLSSINQYIAAQQGNLDGLEIQVRQLESELADIERSGGTIDRVKLNRISALEGRMAQIEADVDGKRDEMNALRSSYAADLKRVQELYGSTPGR